MAVRAGRDWICPQLSCTLPVVEGKDDENKAMKKRVGKLYGRTCGWRHSDTVVLLRFEHTSGANLTFLKSRRVIIHHG